MIPAFCIQESFDTIITQILFNWFFLEKERIFLLMEFIEVATLMFSNQSTLSLFVDFGFPIC